MIAFVLSLLGLETIYFTTTVVWAQNTWIDDRDYPGGPLGYQADSYWRPVPLLGTITWSIASALVQILMLFRCWIIWNRSRSVMILPILVFLASCALSGVSVYQFTKRGQDTLSNTTVNFTLINFGLTTGYNLLLTALIAGRLLYARHTLRAALGKGHARVYITVSAILIESAAFDVASSLFLMVTFAVGDSLFNVALGVQTLVMSIAPMLVLRRVAKGKAFTEGTGTTLADAGYRSQARSTSIRFRPREEVTVDVGDIEHHGESNASFTGDHSQPDAEKSPSEPPGLTTV
ncbi:hypothetical protein EXIGLDRAFT_447900 [Exidia glandulosa HHB12029]|uniref:Uncharacterized protein n=1 Tax=Exidia glandulosa HHB12029 TaxID=1314781 RepID=A0A165B558_EXIGL|nr:hypothetical protein EXIGLDRAFT_447900 [Exidia glandulosa HHB12029]